MQFCRSILLLGWLAAAAAPGQETPAQPAPSTPVIRTEKRLVLVDTVVTDKKGNYIRDLAPKEFRVWEDNKEQEISAVSYEADPAAAARSQKRYLILFFDNSTMGAAEQSQARLASEKFIDANAGPDRLIAIAEFGGRLRIAQNFTPDSGKLKAVVRGVKFSSVSPVETVEVASIGAPPIGRAEADFGVRSLTLALRSLAKNVAAVPGRKTLVLFTAGFPLTNLNRPEVSAAIDACNKANVAIYPIDARGLVAPGGVDAPRGALNAGSPFRLASFAGSSPFVLAAFDPQSQRGGSTGGGATGGGASGAGASRGGGAPSGSPSGGSPGGGYSGGRASPNPNIPGNPGYGRGNPTGANNPGWRGSTNPGGTPNSMPLNQSPYARNPYNQPQRVLPNLGELPSGNQEVMYLLAGGTGGFVIVNTNDLLGGLEKIGHEQNEYYVISYTPAESEEGSCHSLRVKVSRGGTSVRSRSGYCNVKPTDVLAGDPTEKELENHVAGSAAGSMPGSIRVPFFYTSNDTARVDVALEIPTDSLKPEKKKGKLHASINVLGIAYTAENKVAARFSDTVKLDFENKKEFETFQEKPLDYENQFEIASGKYTLKVVYSSGASFGKVEVPLLVDAYDGKKFSMSAIALSRKLQPVSAQSGLDSALLEGKTPLITQGLQVVPTANRGFSKSDQAAIYAELYEPLLASAKPPRVGIQLRVLEVKSGEQKFDSGVEPLDEIIKTGNPVVVVGMRLPLEKLASGAYRLELKAIDTAGSAPIVRTADFEVQ